ncbi:MAG: D-alanine--D-alanine ligase [Candidatus Gastranaerophilales bacterium]|nr:D-alanine--D-alanine ligase [Candidatus Gastranaerophilales bacterium]MCM1073238.1 D-alanine--D-alanine ligase [Bacteroides sp.]
MQYTISKESKIAVLCGGMSSEREISLRSGKNCLAALQRLGYKNAEIVDVSENVMNDLKGFEFAYNTLHGKFGEDGCIQGVLEILKIPYTGCGVMASAICMNKEYTKKVMATAGLPLIKSVYLLEGEDPVEKVKELNYPLMIKPVSEGSSFGMNKVNNEAELVEAVAVARKYNAQVLIEEYLVGIAATVGVLEKDGKAFATEILELRPKNEWYDYEAKYTKGMTEFILPAELSPEMTAQVKEYAVKAFEVCGCSGVSRVDFHIVGDIPYILEVNTNPGMTDTSDLPAQAAAGGISYDNLVEMVLKSAGLNK